MKRRAYLAAAEHSGFLSAGRRVAVG
jgi:hypothetical protein